MFKPIDKNTKYKGVLHRIDQRLIKFRELLNQSNDVELDQEEYLDFITKVAGELHLFIVEGVVTEADLLYHLSKKRTKWFQMPKSATSRLIVNEIKKRIREHVLKN